MSDDLWKDMPDLLHLRKPVPKAISVINHDGIEPDVYDNLAEEQCVALELAKNPFCSPKSRERLRDFAAKCARLLATQRQGEGP